MKRKTTSIAKEINQQVEILFTIGSTGNNEPMLFTVVTYLDFGKHGFSLFVYFPYPNLMNEMSFNKLIFHVSLGYNWVPSFQEKLEIMYLIMERMLQ